ncbi:hypothetical protein JL09_g5834 [Pichia kudriavzevii]|uniref:Uncharacterized protein n=1 Tax=Pichia kudriavzevii TaxID=4909 RepID=A0A099NSX4_PICKU|nr:hypothetical protein JL09_g5834 [Pichia kudriavzevii]
MLPPLFLCLYDGRIGIREGEVGDPDARFDCEDDLDGEELGVFQSFGINDSLFDIKFSQNKNNKVENVSMWNSTE